MNGQQKLIAIPTLLALVEEVITATATITRVIAATAILPVLKASFRFAHFYICRAELCENQKFFYLKKLPQVLSRLYRIFLEVLICVFIIAYEKSCFFMCNVVE
ncbi:MAG TPA: hypothetical protein DER15_07255 [Clostridiales bacterium]|nr:hypothetical protein [Clostridiales bacterium]